MIRLEHVSFEYESGCPVLDDLSFEIQEGEAVGLVGANGAGKSTLLRAMLGLLPCAGITVDDLPVVRENLSRIRKKLGYVLQNSDNQMFMPTVFEDIIFGPVNYGLSRQEAAQKAGEVMEQLGIQHLKDRYNHKISGGEKRMAAIGAVLSMDPEALLLDEPCSALDPYNRRRVIDLLNSLPVTKLVASHDLDMILDTCSRVILLSEGKVKADGPAYEILGSRKLMEDNHLELPLGWQSRGRTGNC